MKYIQIIFLFCLLIMTSQGVLAWGSVRGNDVLNLESAIAPSHDYIDQRAYENLNNDAAFDGSGFPSFELISTNEGQYASSSGKVTGGSPDVTTAYSKHEYNPRTNKGGAPLEASMYYNSLKLNFDNQEKAAHDAAWLAHYVADMSCPYHVNGMPPEDISQYWTLDNRLVLPEKVVGYPLPITNEGMGRINYSLGKEQYQDPFYPIPNMAGVFPDDAPLRGRGWADYGFEVRVGPGNKPQPIKSNSKENWSYEYSNFMGLRNKNNDGKIDWFDPWYTDGTYSYIVKIPTPLGDIDTPIADLFGESLSEQSSTHSLWEWYAFWNYSRPEYSKVEYSPTFIEIQKRNGNGADINIEEFAKKIANNTRYNQTEILDESTSGQSNLPINSKLGQAYQEAISDVYTVWRASFSALRPTVSIEQSSEGKTDSRDVKINIENKANEAVKNVYITASTNSMVWSISPATYNAGEIPAGGKISLDKVFKLTGTTENSNSVLVNITVTGEYQGTPDSGFANKTITFEPPPMLKRSSIEDQSEIWDKPFGSPQYLLHATGHGTMSGPVEDDWYFLYPNAPRKGSDGRDYIDLPDGMGGTFTYSIDSSQGPFNTPREVCDAGGGWSSNQEFGEWRSNNYFKCSDMKKQQPVVV